MRHRFAASHHTSNTYPLMTDQANPLGPSLLSDRCTLNLVPSSRKSRKFSQQGVTQNKWFLLREVLPENLFERRKDDTETELTLTGNWINNLYKSDVMRGYN